MYVSKAMQNMRADSLGSTAQPANELPWFPAQIAANAGLLQSAGNPYSTSVGGCIVFSTGDTIPDSLWNTIYASALSLTTINTAITNAGLNCTMSAIQNGTGNSVRLINQGDGTRMFDILSTALSRISYAQPFNRMYLLVGIATAALGVSTAIGSIVEFTPADLIAMGAGLTNNNDGTYTLNGPIVLNNITFS